MSAFVVSDRTINLIVATARFGLSEFDRQPTLLNGLSGVDLAVALRRLNERAVCARYSDGTIAGDVATVVDMAGGEFVYRQELPPPVVVVHKAVSCLLYQCSEGEVPSDPLYVALAAFKDRLADAIVCELPAWKSAPWG